MGGGDDVVLGDRVALELADDHAGVEDQHAIAAADQLGVVGGVQEDRGPLVGEPAQQLVELLLGADVDAAGRIAEQDDLRPGQQPLSIKLSGLHK